MAANARRRSRGARDVYREITERILDALEAGTVPWRRPWRDFGMQRNFSSARPYRGINQLLTQLTQQARGYGSPFWLTYRGAERAGGNVRRGERGSMVVLWKHLLIEDEETAERRTVWWIRPYTVFNLDQVDGVEPPPLQDELLEFEPIERCESLLGSMPEPPAVEHAPAAPSTCRPQTRSRCRRGRASATWRATTRPASTRPCTPPGTPRGLTASWRRAPTRRPTRARS